MINWHDERGYIDPGSFTMILQVLLAGLLAGLFMLKTFWHKVRHFVSALFSKNKDANE